MSICWYFADGDEAEGAEEAEGGSPGGGQAMAAQLNNIRLKLEEKRRRIELEKRRMEVAVTRRSQQLGQQAFLQAVTRVRTRPHRHLHLHVHTLTYTNVSTNVHVRTLKYTKPMYAYVH